jgi:hypothetical protein
LEDTSQRTKKSGKSVNESGKLPVKLLELQPTQENKNKRKRPDETFQEKEAPQPLIEPMLRPLLSRKTLEEEEEEEEDKGKDADEECEDNDKERLGTILETSFVIIGKRLACLDSSGATEDEVRELNKRIKKRKVSVALSF